MLISWLFYSAATITCYDSEIVGVPPAAPEFNVFVAGRFDPDPPTLCLLATSPSFVNGLRLLF